MNRDLHCTTQLCSFATASEEGWFGLSRIPDIFSVSSVKDSRRRTSIGLRVSISADTTGSGHLPDLTALVLVNAAAKKKVLTESFSCVSSLMMIEKAAHSGAVVLRSRI